MAANFKTLMILAWLMFRAVSALAGEPAYLDERSNALQLISSYFNAINRHEFARAWSYWREGMPGVTYKEFVERYNGIISIDFVPGVPVWEGAAGSIYFQVPLALRRNSDNNRPEMLRGCFVVKQVNPKIQDPPFTPMQIIRGNLTRVKGVRFAEIVPGDCKY